METHLIQIGNSRGIRIPKRIIEDLNLDRALDMSVQDDVLVIKAKQRQARLGWEELYSAGEPEDLMMPDHIDPSTEELEWEW